jgi:hypothetical protein
MPNPRVTAVGTSVYFEYNVHILKNKLYTHIHAYLYIVNYAKKAHKAKL